MSKYKHLNSQIFKAWFVYTLTVFSLFYLFLVKGLVYPSDLTGAEAELMITKEANYGTEATFYIDKVAPPVAMFYLDGDYTEVEYSELELRLAAAEYNEPIYYITKESRQERILLTFPRAVVLAAEGDHVLGFLDSQEVFDRASQPTDLTE